MRKVIACMLVVLFALATHGCVGYFPEVIRQGSREVVEIDDEYEQVDEEAEPAEPPDMAAAAHVLGGRIVTAEEAANNAKRFAIVGANVVGLQADGTLIKTDYHAFGAIDGIYDWEGIVAISASGNNSDNIIGLKSDGTVVIGGTFTEGSAEAVEGWEDIVSIVGGAGESHFAGLKSDGTVVAFGADALGQLDVSHWTDIERLFIARGVTFGITSDDSIVTAGQLSYSVWENGQHKGFESYEIDFGEWVDIVQIIASGTISGAYGLRADGTIVMSLGFWGDNPWTDIVQLASKGSSLIGLRSDGTIAIVGRALSVWEQEITQWTDIVAIQANSHFVVGMKKDGSFEFASSSNLHQIDISDWNLGY